MGTEIQNVEIQKHEEAVIWTEGPKIKIRAPNVQEMVRINPQDVPERFMGRNEGDSDGLVSDEIPFIDMALLVSGDEEERQKLHSAFKDWGFFQLINHGIEDRIFDNIMAAHDDFSALPIDEKLKYAKGTDDFQGYGKNFVIDDEQKIDWNDSMGLIAAPTHYRNLKLWPTELVPNYLNAVDEYSRELDKLTTEIFGNLSLLMGMERDALKAAHAMVTQLFGMNYYPQCARPDLVYGTAPHSDVTTITFLLQDDNRTGLQFEHNRAWIQVPPVPHAFVVSVGDVLEAFSNGMYKSIVHRVITNKEKARKSVVLAATPQYEATFGPVESMIDDSHPRMYRNITYGEYIAYGTTQKLNGRANIEYLKLHDTDN